MTIKHLDKNISAEKEGVVVDAKLNKSTGVLSLYLKNQHDDEDSENSPIQLKLNDISLNIVKKTRAYVEELVDTTDENKITERESTLFLVPLDDDEDDPDSYQELVWSKDKNDFENIGTTRIDLEPIQSVLNLETENGVTKSNRLNKIERDINSLDDNKVDKTNFNTGNVSTVEGYDLSNAVDRWGHLPSLTCQEGINEKIILDLNDINNDIIQLNSDTSDCKNDISVLSEEIDDLKNEKPFETIDTDINASSTNPVTNKAISSALNGKADSIHTQTANTIFAVVLDRTEIYQALANWGVQINSSTKLNSFLSSFVMKLIPQLNSIETNINNKQNLGDCITSIELVPKSEDDTGAIRFYYGDEE